MSNGINSPNEEPLQGHNGDDQTYDLSVKAKVCFVRPHPHTILYYVIFIIRRARGEPCTPSVCKQFFETTWTVRVQQRMGEVDVVK